MILDQGAVVVDRNVGVVVRDGTRLSLDVYRPNRPGRFPAILEHIPYRKDDFHALLDRGQNIELVRAGFACVRLDVRGTGSSAGVAMDEYTEAEQHDGVEVVEWIARQPWCTGAIGSWGKSYGGFSCIQLAAHRPAALKAIAAVYGTDDRYSDDMHFDGGALCAFELTNYPIRMIAMNALPPLGQRDEVFDQGWRERIERTPPWVVRWLREQGDGRYWRNGSLRPGYERITCPVFIVSGWRDGYRTAGVRMVNRLSSPVQLLAGPWAHFPPDRGIPGPAYPFMAELTRFFRRHLADAPEEASRPPCVFFLGWHDPSVRLDASVPGQWYGSYEWPETAGTTTVVLGGPTVAPASVTVGLMTGNWCPPPPDHGQFPDQRADNARSARFTGPELSEQLDLLGIPTVRFTARHPHERTIVAVKLNDVAPDGSSKLVTRGALNAELAGETELTVPLMATGWRFLPGHRVRVTVAVNDWPCLWPLPTLGPLEVTSAVTLVLPGLPTDAVDSSASDLPVPVTWDQASRRSGPSRWQVVTDAMREEAGITAGSKQAFQFPDGELTCVETQRFEAFARDREPLTARTAGMARLVVSRPGLTVRAQADGRFRGTDKEFLFALRLRVWADDRLFAERQWQGGVPRIGC